jgi:hypothetical protein
VNFPIQHQLLTIGGPLFGLTAERWSIGLRFTGFSPPGTPPQARVDACEAPIRTWFTNPSSYIASNHSVDLIKLAPIDVTGLYPAGQSAVIKVPSPAMIGGGAGGSQPPQCTLVMSLITGVPRGRAHIGRVYPPPLRSAQVANPGLVPADVLSMINTFRTMVNSLNGISGLGVCSVMSKLGSGLSFPVTAIRAGIVIDTQRRRRAQIGEAYQTVAL